MSWKTGFRSICCGGAPVPPDPIAPGFPRKPRKTGVVSLAQHIRELIQEDDGIVVTNTADFAPTGNNPRPIPLDCHAVSSPKPAGAIKFS